VHFHDGLVVGVGEDDAFGFAAGAARHNMLVETPAPPISVPTGTEPVGLRQSKIGLSQCDFRRCSVPNGTEVGGAIGFSTNMLCLAAQERKAGAYAKRKNHTDQSNQSSKSQFRQRRA
jgi:hypothetical protein